MFPIPIHSTCGTYLSLMVGSGKSSSSEEDGEGGRGETRDCCVSLLDRPGDGDLGCGVSPLHEGGEVDWC
jgi:hypothetical protein